MVEIGFNFDEEVTKGLRGELRRLSADTGKSSQELLLTVATLQRVRSPQGLLLDGGATLHVLGKAQGALSFGADGEMHLVYPDEL